MKTTALPSKITSLLAFIGFVFLAAAAILTLLALLFSSTSHAGTIVAGGQSFTSGAPFGFTDQKTALYVGRYQQIYEKFRFPAATWITQIAFMEVGARGPVDVSYSLSLGLGVTGRTLSNPGVGFASGATQLLNGVVNSSLTAAAGDFDLLFNLPTPFLYDPAQGNLLLDLSIVFATQKGASATGGLFAAASNNQDTGRIYSEPGNVLVQPFTGLKTQFTTAPVPEPATAALTALGSVLCLRRRGRKIRS